MSRGPGRWQRLLLDALAEAEPLQLLRVADVGLHSLGKPMTPSEYRALNRAAWLLDGRGLHCVAATEADYRGHPCRRLLMFRCCNCSPEAPSEHIAALPCRNCRTPTTERDPYRGAPDCGGHRRVVTCSFCGQRLMEGASGYGDTTACARCIDAAVSELPAQMADLIRGLAGLRRPGR